MSGGDKTEHFPPLLTSFIVYSPFLELLGSMASEKDANTLDEGQQDAPIIARAHHGQWATWRKGGDREVESGENRKSRNWKGLGPGVGALTAGSQHSPSQCSTGDGIPGIFPLPRSRTRPQSMVENKAPHWLKLPVETKG